MFCLECGEGFHTLCRKGKCACKHDSQSDGDTKQPSVSEESAKSPESQSEPDDGAAAPIRIRKSRKGQKLDPDRPRERGRKKNDSTLKDPKSTGRHRAVSMHGRADRSAPCEWQGLANCGGGIFTIVGCAAGVQESLHHGPDKNTLNNERTNIHKICYNCHNRWHTLNDPNYIPEGPHAAHDPRPATIDDIMADAKFWAAREVKRKRGD